MAKKKTLGIDLGTNSLKLALCQDGRVLRTARQEVPGDLFQGSRVNSVEVMGQILQNTMKENGIRANRAAVVLSNEVCFLRNLTMPKMTVRQLEQNLPYEFTDYVEGELKNYLFDYELVRPIAPEDEEMELMAVAVERSLLSEMREWLSVAGLELVNAAPCECCYQALIRAARGDVAGLPEYCFLNLGNNATRMFMFKGDRHTATRILETGLRNLDLIVSRELGITLEQAHASLLTNEHDCQNLERCVDLYNTISVELMRALNFYRFSTQDSNLEDVWISGGGGANEPLRAVVGETLGVRIHRSRELVYGGERMDNCHDYLQAIGITLGV